jgi:AbrB family looped-hinge helix DNA binding protein
MGAPHATVVSSKGWVVIPQELRQRYGLKPGTRVEIVEYAGVLSIHPIPDDPIAAARGMLKGGSSMTAEIVEEHRREREREDAR